jgi:quercetin dioxygenase-like cupin family protein
MHVFLGRPQDRRNDHTWSAGPDSRNRWNTGDRFATTPDIRHHLCVKGEENPWIEIAPGIKRRTVCAGASMYQMRAELAAGSRLPEHAHRQEQIAHVIKGRMKLIVSGVPHELAAGDAFYLASNVPHGVETLEATTVIDTFSPPRDDYLALDNGARRAAE